MNFLDSIHLIGVTEVANLSLQNWTFYHFCGKLVFICIELLFIISALIAIGHSICRFAGNKVCLRDVSQRFGVCHATTFRQNDRVLNFLIDMAPKIIKFGDNEVSANDFLQVC
jgi:hypothetical protein